MMRQESWCWSARHGRGQAPSATAKGILMRRRSRATAGGLLGRRGLHVAGVGALVVATMALPSMAWAHVTVQPGEVEGGGFSVVSFRVPTERDNATTTEVRVLLPEEQPVGSVRTRAVPGWEVTTKNRTLDEPIDMFGEEVDSVVSE